jgi:mono/diheme cytochrome c family protein
MRNAHSPLVLASLVSIGCGGSPAATEPAELAGAATTASASGASGQIEGGGGTTPANTSGGSGPFLGSGGGGSTGAAGSAGTNGASGGGGASGSSWMTAFTTPPAGCAVCHGSMGAGVPGLGPDIQHPTRELFDYLVRNGEPNRLAQYAAPMPALGDTLVSDADLNAIFAWLGAMPQPTTGGALFADYCSYCHGADGRGGVATVAYASAYHSAPFRRKGVEFRDYVRAGHLVDDQGVPVPVSERHAYMPAFGPELLSDAEIAQIEGWLPQ